MKRFRNITHSNQQQPIQTRCHTRSVAVESCSFKANLFRLNSSFYVNPYNTSMVVEVGMYEFWVERAGGEKLMHKTVLALSAIAAATRWYGNLKGVGQLPASGFDGMQALDEIGRPSNEAFIVLLRTAAGGGTNCIMVVHGIKVRGFKAGPSTG